MLKNKQISFFSILSFSFFIFLIFLLPKTVLAMGKIVEPKPYTQYDEGVQDGIRWSILITKKELKTNEIVDIEDSVYIDETSRANWEFLEKYDTPQGYIYQNQTSEKKEGSLLKNYQELVVKPKIPGELIIPERKVSINLEDGSIKTITLPQVKLVVSSLFSENLTKEQVQTLNQESLTYTFIPARYIIGGIIGIILFICVIILLIIFIRQQIALYRIRHLPKPISADVEALQELERLKKALIQNIDISPIYLKSNFILRRYLSTKLNLPILEQTSEEIKQTLQSLHELKTLSSKIEKHLDEADLIKFAKSEPTKLVVEASIDFCENLVFEIKQSIKNEEQGE